MSSFTSSSKRRVYVSLTAFLATFAIVVVVGQKLGRTVADFPFGKRVMDNGLSTARPLSNPQDWYIAVDHGLIDHYVLYHGLGDSIQFAREADVLLIGNSRMSYAFPYTVLESAAQKTGLRFYNLGFGCGERYEFILSLIQKHDLRPQIVIAHEPQNFFSPERGISVVGKKVMESSRWEAWKTVWEWSLTQRLRRSSLFECLPNWRVISPVEPDNWVIICRSISLGSWLAYREKQRLVPVGTPQVNFSVETDAIKVDPRTYLIAQGFKRALTERGAKLVLTWIPNADPTAWIDRHKDELLAKSLEVPFISPLVPGLVTRDTSHLDDKSAELFATRFIEDFRALLEASLVGDD
jgi:hypothetical protein